MIHLSAFWSAKFSKLDAKCAYGHDLRGIDANWRSCSVEMRLSRATTFSTTYREPPINGSMGKKGNVCSLRDKRIRVPFKHSGSVVLVQAGHPEEDGRAGQPNRAIFARFRDFALTTNPQAFRIPWGKMETVLGPT